MNKKMLYFVIFHVLFYLIHLNPEVLAKGLEEESTLAKHKKKISLRLMGGISSISSVDVNDYIMGVVDFWSDADFIHFVDAAPNFDQLLSKGQQVGGEIVLNMTSRFSIGLGASYIRAKSEIVTETFWYDEGNSFEDIFNMSVKSVPISLNLHYCILNRKRISVTSFIGTGYYLSNLKWNYSWKRLDVSYSYSENFNGKSNSIGVHGGLYLEFKLNRMFAIVAEGAGKYVRLSDFQDKSGRIFWTYDFLHSITNKTYNWISFSKEEPSGSNLSNIRKGEVDLSGFSLMIGFKIGFK